MTMTRKKIHNATRKKYNNLSQRVEELIIKQFGIERFNESSSEICFYIGFPNYETLIACFNFLNLCEHGQNIVYCNMIDKMKSCGPNSTSRECSGNKAGRRRKLSILNMFLWFLYK